MNTIPLWNSNHPELNGATPSLTTYLHPGNAPRPAILIIPGGGYGCVCEQTEGAPIARRFLELGFHAFVLNYRVAPHRFPAPLEDAMRAMRLIRGNAGQWGVIADRIAACGFSAGGHLAASLGTLTNRVSSAVNGDRYDQCSPVPDALLLCYPVISLEQWSHQDSGRNLLGELTEEQIRDCSLERHITAQTPPAMLWHTITDQVVSYRNSIVFTEAMIAAKRPCELHLFPFGQHGMLLGSDTSDISQWPEQAAAFLYVQWENRATPDVIAERYTNVHQTALINQG